MNGIIRPRLTDQLGIEARQSELSFAIPFLHEDIPLYLDPFLLWKSPSQQDQTLYEGMMNAFNRLGRDAKKDPSAATEVLKRISECDEIGLGNSATRRGLRISSSQAGTVLSLFERLPHFARGECEHIEELQLLVDGIAKDRISDFACNFLKSFLIDFTMDEADKLGIPLADVKIPDVYNHKNRAFAYEELVKLPINPANGKPILFAPKRWLRFVPWLNFEDYFKSYCPQDDVAHSGEKLDRVSVLAFNRHNYGAVQEYIKAKERTASDAANDPLFSQMPAISAKRLLKRLSTLDTGKDNGRDKEYEHIVEQLLPSLLYPDLDFAEAQSRTVSGVSIRDLIFYNNQDDPFLKEISSDYGSRQIPFELKNVAEVQREHIDQLNRYLSPGLGHFGVLVTRRELSSARRKQVVDLWSGQRKAIVTLTDGDLALMCEVFETKQRKPIEVLKKKFVEFRRSCPG